MISEHNHRTSNPDPDRAYWRKYHFIEYASGFWAFHLQGHDSDDEFYRLFKRVVAQKTSLRILNYMSRKSTFFLERPPIWLAAELGFMNIIQYLIEDGYDVNEYCHGCHLIHTFDLMRLLTYSKIQDKPTEPERTKSLKALNRLLTLGMDINGRDERESTVLMCLTSEAQYEKDTYNGSDGGKDAKALDEDVARGVRTWLSMSNVDINARDRWGYTALHIAARHITPVAKSLIQILMSHPDINLNPEDDQGRTPLNVAIHWGKQETCVFLLKVPGIQFDASSIQGESPLINAARQEWPDLVALMLESLTSNEINDHLDLHRRSILRWTIASRMVEASLLTLQKSPALFDSADMRGATPLHLAAETGQYQIAQALLSHGACPIRQNRFSETAVQMAAAQGHLKVLKLLIDALPLPSDINIRDAMGWTPTHRAVTSGNEHLQRFLLSLATVDTKRADRHGRTPVAFAASIAPLNTLKYFLQASPEDIDFVDEFGNTLLHLAATGNDESTVPFLLKSIGRRGNEINDWGKTALDLLPPESPLRDDFLRLGLRHTKYFLNVKPRCLFTGIRPREQKVHYDWVICCSDDYGLDREDIWIHREQGGAYSR